MNELKLTIPLIPPSVNHYKKRARNGHYFITDEARIFKAEVWLAAERRNLRNLARSKNYELEATVFLGKGQRGDGDNFWKVLGDSLVEAGLIHSDAAVSDWIMHVRRDPANPRTEITVRAIG